MKVYDCFIFFNEFELLELRLSTLNHGVDYFVIVESNSTFKGEAKVFNFEKRKPDFSEYSKKIIYVKVDDMPRFTGENGWELEHFQRNCILRGLKNCSFNDLIILSDIDEIPDPTAIINVKNNNIHTSYWFTEHGLLKRLRRYFKWFFKINILSCGNVLKKYPIVCEQKLYYYFVNCQSKGVWEGSIFCLYENFKNPQKIRDLRTYIPRIKNAGWHFSYLGGMERIFIKLKAINEGEKADSTPEYIQKCLTEGTDLYGRKGREYEYDFKTVDEISLPDIEIFIQKYPSLYRNF